MGFWDTVGKVAGYAANEAKGAMERQRQYQEEMPSKSDNELAYIIKREHSSSPLKAGAAMKELQSRGYDKESIQDLVRNA